MIGEGALVCDVRGFERIALTRSDPARRCDSPHRWHPRGTEEASTPSEIQSVRWPAAATTPLCVMSGDTAGRPAGSTTRCRTRSN